MEGRKPLRINPLEVNDIDHAVRFCGRRTLALEMDPLYLEQFKQDSLKDIEYLTRRLGDLRLEAVFYRECFQHSQMFKDAVSSLAQELLHQCIIGLLRSASFQATESDTFINDIKTISGTLLSAVEKLQEQQSASLSSFLIAFTGTSDILQTTNLDYI